VREVGRLNSLDTALMAWAEQQFPEAACSADEAAVVSYCVREG
jgi:hypothetical protein